MGKSLVPDLNTFAIARVIKLDRVWLLLVLLSLYTSTPATLNANVVGSNPSLFTVGGGPVSSGSTSWFGLGQS